MTLDSDDIQAIAKALFKEMAPLMGLPVASPALPADPGQYAIQLARSGKREESIQFLKSYSKSQSKRVR